MTSVVKTKIYDLLPQLTMAVSFSVRENDIIVAAPGFEDRTMALATDLHIKVAANAILIDYVPSNPGNRLHDLKARFSACGVRVHDNDILKYDRFDPADFESRLETRLKSLNMGRLIIDISTMSKLLILLVLNVARKSAREVGIYYAEAASYHPTESEFETAREANRVHQPSLQIFTGVHGVVRVDSLASVAMQGQQTAAIVFMSFNDALTQVLLNTVYPGRLLLINGRPPVHTWREHATAWIHDQVRREWIEDNPLKYTSTNLDALPMRAVSTLDYRETVMLLLGLYWELSATNRILLAPAGSKMQAIGSFLVKALHPDIHIEYPSPNGFIREYSSGIGSKWALNFGQLSELVKSLAQSEREQYLEIDTTARLASGNGP